MATQAIAAHAPFGAVNALREYNLASEIFAGIVTWYQKHKTRQELIKLTDAQLDDIGLARKDLI
ncbi:MAG: DUF1127 domain-containing protein [Cognatishimia sp.]|uniref:DUF1127 domain-containing protein n=1 Tax=Cognatishimia sp. TaxID=2211648 RepID=UPI003B8C4596